MTNSWAEFEKIGLLPDGGVDQRVGEFKNVLDKKISQLKKKSRRKRLIKISSISFIIFFIRYFGFSKWKIRAMIVEFDSYKKGRMVRPFEKLYQSTKTYNWPVAFLARMGPDLKKAYGYDQELDKYNLLVDDINRLVLRQIQALVVPLMNTGKNFKILKLAFESLLLT